MLSCALNFFWLTSASVPVLLCHLDQPKLARRLSVLICALAAVDLYPRVAALPDRLGCLHASAAVCDPLERHVLGLVIVTVMALLSALIVVKSALIHELFSMRHIPTILSVELIHSFLYYFCGWYPASLRDDGGGDMSFCFSRVVVMASALVVNGFYFVPVMYTIMAALMMMSNMQDSVPSTPYTD